MENIEDFVIEKGVLIEFKGSGGDVVIPEGVTEIGERAFAFCSDLKNIMIPDSVTEIGGSAFYNCRSLTSITIPEGVTEIGWGTFEGCSSLTSIVIPSSITEIGCRAFEGCSRLTNVILQEGVTEIGEGAFEGCRSLTNIVIPESVTKIGERAFYDCSSLTNIVIPESVTEIGGCAFRDCSKLKNITLPGNVREIASNIFDDCTELKEIYLTGSELQVDFREVFQNSDFIALYAPEISLSSFQGTKAQKYAVMGYLNHISETENQGKECRQEYVKYIKSRKDAREVLYERVMEDETVTVFAVEEKLIPIGEVDSLIEKATKNKKKEIAALLLEYKNSGFTQKGK